VRTLRVLPPLLLLAVALAATTTAAAQNETAGALTLLSQSPWTGPNHPLELGLRIENTTDATLGDLSLTLSIETPTRSRTEYDQAMRSTQPRIAVVSVPHPIPGSIAPGASRRIEITQPLTGLSETALYPVRVDLFSSLSPVATLRTPMVYLMSAPKLPLLFTTTWVLWEPLQLGPDGVLGSGPITSDISPGGRLEQTIAAIHAGPSRADVAVSPVLVDELRTMAGGYRMRSAPGARVTVVHAGTGGAADATRVLGELRSLAHDPGIELVALPFGDPSLPALVHGGLSTELRTLVLRGAQEISSGLSATPVASVARPPFSEVDTSSLGQLVRTGARTILLDPGIAPPPIDDTFSPPPVAPLVTGGRTATGVAPDELLASDMQQWAAQDPPVLAAQLAVGELATIYLESPGTPHRGAAVIFPERTPESVGFLQTFAALAGHEPWLKPATASTLAADVRANRSAVRVRPRVLHAFPAGYALRYRATRDALTQFESAVLNAQGLDARLRTNVLYSIGGTAVRNVPVGLSFMSSVTSTVEHLLGQIRPRSGVVTLTERSGPVYLTVANDSIYTAQVVVRLVSASQLTFPHGNRRTITIAPNTSQFLSFAVQTKTTGRFPVSVQIFTRAGRQIAETQMIVRSTAYNLVALVVTLGAALFLLAWWGRRFLPRRTS
jgi:hypothetical protein